MSAVYLHQGERVSRQRRILDKTRKRCTITRRGCGVDQALLSSLGAVYVADEGHHQVKFMDVGSENRHCHDHIRGPPHPKRVSPSSQLILIQSPQFEGVQHYEEPEPQCHPHPAHASPHRATWTNVKGPASSMDGSGLLQPRGASTMDDTEDVAFTERQERPRGM